MSATRQHPDPFEIGDRVVIRGGFEDGLRGVIVANEPNAHWPWRYRVRLSECRYCGAGPCRSTARSANGIDLARFERIHRDHPNHQPGTIGGIHPIHLEMEVPT